MITNEQFKKCADLCDKRLALLRMSKEINEVINDSPIKNEELKRDFYKENKSWGPFWKLFIIVFLLAIPIFFVSGIGIELEGGKVVNEDMFFINVYKYSFVVALLAGIIAKSCYNRKIKIECEKLLVRNTSYSKTYYELLPDYKEFGGRVNNSIINITKEITDMNAIPEKYWDVASELWYFVTVHEAEDYREAVRIWEDIQHKLVIENLAREQVYYAQEAAEYAEESREYAYQSMVSSQNAERKSDINLLLSAYTAYKVS